MPRLRTRVYIDGFNLYYGAVRGTPNKWLNLEKYFMSILPKDDVERIKYFTALVKGETAPNQEVFLAALRTLRKVEIVLGLFQKTKVECKHKTCAHPTPPKRRFKDYEEKQTDVNVAIHLLEDAVDGLVEHQVIVSGDSDLVPALRVIRRRYPHIRLTVVVPATEVHRAKSAVELRSMAHNAFVMPIDVLRRCQFPDTVTTKAGVVLEKPRDWYVV